MISNSITSSAGNSSDRHEIDFDIHDRVNYSVKKTTVKINEEKSIIKLKLTIDTKYGSIIDTLIRLNFKIL